MVHQDQNEPTFEQIGQQLQRRVLEYPYKAWGRRQTDDWDRQTNFVYHLYRWDDLYPEIVKLENPVADYAVNRWFNFWSAVAVERIFCTLPGVEAHINQYDRLVDFSIQRINFDHKTSVFPKNYGYSPKFAWYNKSHLIKWLYLNQSQEQRYHLANRLFIILYARDGEHWKLRAEITRLQEVIESYVNNFNPSKLIKLSSNDARILSDVIWFVK
jgi:hypothetical protein